MVPNFRLLTFISHTLSQRSNLLICNLVFTWEQRHTDSLPYEICEAFWLYANLDTINNRLVVTTNLQWTVSA